MVLLMAIVNITNLLLARGTARRREFAIRLATGAGRARLAKQLLTETLLLLALGTIPGVLFAGQGVDMMEGLFVEGRRAITFEANLNWRVLAFSMLISLAAGILAGLFPAWRAFRTEPEAALREGQGRTSESRGPARLTRMLVAFQVAISLVLLVAAVTFIRTLINLRNVDPGFRNEHVVTMSIGLPDGYVQTGQSLVTWSRVLQAVREIPGIRSAALSNYTPLSGRDRGALVRIHGYQPATVSDSAVHYNHVSEGYFETLGIPLIRGRMLTGRDAEGSAKVALITQAAARKFFAGRDPLGQTVAFTRKGAQTMYVASWA
jgi:predicted permease